MAKTRIPNVKGKGNHDKFPGPVVSAPLKGKGTNKQIYKPKAK